MSSPAELTLDEIRNYMVINGGKVTNHDLVKHFKRFLTNPDNRDESRALFKKFVNSLATIKNQDGEKWLILKAKHDSKKQFELPITHQTEADNRIVFESTNDITQPTTIGTVNPDFNDTHVLDSDNAKECSADISIRTPPPYRLPPLVLQSPNNSESENQNVSVGVEHIDMLSPTNEPLSIMIDKNMEDRAPVLPPKRKISIDKTSFVNENKFSSSTYDTEDQGEGKENHVILRSSVVKTNDGEQKLSVKERMQKFHKLTSDGEHVRYQLSAKKSDKGADHEDRASVVSLDPKAHEWILRASQGDYHSLSKLCNENPQIVKVKDPATGYTALHWACKYGNEDLVKLLCGLFRAAANERTNGGYTPLHIAMQFRHNHIYNLLIQCYDADPNIRDWSGRMPRQYPVRDNTALSPETYRNSKTKAEKTNSDLGFLRIGSLNVHVKKTTEAFSNFLGAGASFLSSGSVDQEFSNPRLANSRLKDPVIKPWGSADNLEGKLMPPPTSGKVSRRAVGGRKREYDSSHSHSTPGTPNQARSPIGSETIPHSLSEHGQNDSDSDTACGFDDSWKGKPA